MNLINQLFFAVLISSVTSTFLVFVWWALRGFFMETNAKLIYITLRWICIMYLVPFGYIATLLTYRRWFRGREQIWKLVFVRTFNMTGELWLLAVAWFLVASFLIIRYMFERIGWRVMLADNIPEDDPFIVSEFCRACSKLNIRADRVALNRNVKADMPFIIGFLRPQVVIPEQDYTKEDLEIIFFHELSHYKHKDLVFKAMSVLIMMLHFFNPVVYQLLQRINTWSEYMADLSALEASGNLDNIKPYFDNIMRLIPDSSKKDKVNGLISTLCDDDKILARRVDFMDKYRKIKSAGKVVTAALTAAFVLLSATTAYASGKTVADWHNTVYQNTEERANVTGGTAGINQDGAVEDSQEHYISIEDLNKGGVKTVSTPDEDIVSFARGVHYNFDWIVESNTRHVTGEYYIENNQSITVVAAVTPRDKEFWLGIMNDHGSAWYVVGRGSASHTFYITESGRYRVFVQNNYRSSTDLHATGYFVYDY